MRPRRELPATVEEHRDERWWRDPTRQVATVIDAERFVEQVSFATCMTDARHAQPSLYVAVCGRRDAIMPRNVQKDPDASMAWTLKDQMLRRGRVYYGKLARGKAMFLAPRLVPAFHAVWGVRRAAERDVLSANARAVLRVLRREWEMGTADLRAESRVVERRAFSAALDELQAGMLVVPSDVLYRPTFTYIWTLAVGRFPNELTQKLHRDAAVKEIARSFLVGAGTTFPGELARATGLSRPEAGLGNRALVAEGFAITPERGVYCLRHP